MTITHTTLNGYLYEVLLRGRHIISITRYEKDRITLGVELEWDDLSEEEQEKLVKALTLKEE